MHRTLCNQHIQKNIDTSQSCICMKTFMVLNSQKQQGPKKSELPHNRIYQNDCAICLVKEDYPLRISSCECLPWKNSPDLQEEIRCGQELC